MSLHKIPRTLEQEMKHDIHIMLILLFGLIGLITEMVYCLIIKGI